MLVGLVAGRRSSGDRSQEIGAGRQEIILFIPPTPYTLHPTPSLITDYCLLITDRGFHL
ncbi:hypothetical protein VL20_3844 [Microcystis panniformis FACHB-1757]|uniref:Uncharacterized protein n=1 Tax=Microcystis panniformis FACHB-1757 TaxID=1638788 RepID=A0A0K1S3T3_9CHRO|nr:hypothetical protein VL20_3844 [Microcystis panniformis FACHB-1757]